MNEILRTADAAARAIALTALDRTLLVEAGAGSGKTSVLAGRVTSTALPWNDSYHATVSIL
jgi:ATP-dependent exoDNAse (exonuclease V) beta subunit